MSNSERKTIQIQFPRLGQSYRSTDDQQAIAFAAAVSDIVTYVVYDNVFTPDVNYIASLIAQRDTATLDFPSTLKTLLVTLDTKRNTSLTGDHLWDEIKSIPSTFKYYYIVHCLTSFVGYTLHFGE